MRSTVRLLVALALTAVSNAASGQEIAATGPTPTNKSTALTALRFTKDYFPGTKDRNGQLMGGVECNYIVVHGRSSSRPCPSSASM
jgi:hypothetical protein